MNKKKFVNIDTTGFGIQAKSSASRMYNKDGTPNVIKKGVRLIDRLSWFHTLLSIPRWKFWIWLFSLFVGINLFFGLIYYLLGSENLIGIAEGSELKKFAESFFFSTQTFTTVGYGRISPSGLIASSIASLEAFLGVLGFALATGLFYGRFSRPRAFLYFSENCLISPYKEGTALMFRMVPYKNSHLMEAEVKLTVALKVDDNGKKVNRFYSLDVEFSKINSLLMNWTIVHALNENSPLYGMSIEEMEYQQIEIMVFLKAYDEVFSNTVIARTSYSAGDIVEGARFVPMYHPSETGDATILEVDKVNVFERVQLPLFKPEES
ncbi:MAG: ion channel [Candidatus Dadabacteria bacterium]